MPESRSSPADDSDFGLDFAEAGNRILRRVSVSLNDCDSLEVERGVAVFNRHFVEANAPQRIRLISQSVNRPFADHVDHAGDRLRPDGIRLLSRRMSVATLAAALRSMASAAVSISRRSQLTRWFIR